MFNVTVISPSEVQVLWNQPEITNGEIVLYSVEIYISTRINVTRNVAAGQPLEVFVGDRGKHLVYVDYSSIELYCLVPTRFFV